MRYCLLSEKFYSKWLMLKIRLNILQQCLVLGGLHKTQHADLEMKEHSVLVTWLMRRCYVIESIRVFYCLQFNQQVEYSLKTVCSLGTWILSEINCFFPQLSVQSHNFLQYEKLILDFCEVILTVNGLLICAKWATSLAYSLALPLMSFFFFLICKEVNIAVASNSSSPRNKSF